MVFFSANRCKCLGDFKNADLSRQALDMFCRNDSYRVLDGFYRDSVTRKYLKEVVPSKVAVEFSFNWFTLEC